MATKLDEKSILEDDKVQKEELREKIKQILKSNGVHDSISEIVIKDAGLQGEGFSSLTELVTVKFENPERKSLNLFVKIQTGNPSHTKMLTDIKAFEKESTFLTDYCQAAKESCTSKGYPDFLDFYPKCYYGDGKLIVLENLKLDKGYSLKSKEERQDLESSILAIKTLAKHHAISHVMINESGGAEKFFKKFPYLDLEYLEQPGIAEIVGDMCNNAIDSNVKILGKNDVSGAKEAAEKLKEFIGKPKAIMMNSLKTCDDEEPPFLVLGHGDYWNNNMMFLVDAHTKKNLHHVIIDFQTTRYNTPALDLVYYIFTTVHHEVRSTQLLELLTIYKETLNKVTEDFGYPTNLTLDQIFKDFRKKIGHGFWYGLVMNVGSGMALFKDIDISKMDMNEWPVVMDQLINKWIDENPEKGKETADELVEMIQEYKQLRI